ncbi:hypothetical protein BDV10DRAFT_91512 [Aspergillus recurvatus]
MLKVLTVESGAILRHFPQPKHPSIDLPVQSSSLGPGRRNRFRVAKSPRYGCSEASLSALPGVVRSVLPRGVVAPKAVFGALITPALTQPNPGKTVIWSATLESRLRHSYYIESSPRHIFTQAGYWRSAVGRNGGHWFGPWSMRRCLCHVMSCY